MILIILSNNLILYLFIIFAFIFPLSNSSQIKIRYEFAVFLQMQDHIILHLIIQFIHKQ